MTLNQRGVYVCLNCTDGAARNNLSKRRGYSEILCNLTGKPSFGTGKQVLSTGIS